MLYVHSTATCNFEGLGRALQVIMWALKASAVITFNKLRHQCRVHAHPTILPAACVYM